MGIVIIRQDDKIENWIQALKKAAPDIPIYSHFEEHPKESVKMAVVWKPPMGAFNQYPNLECIGSSGAGVDFLFEDKDLPKHLPITRVVDEYLAKDMSEHVIALIFSHLKNLNQYKLDQFNKVWKPIDYQRIEDLTIGIMGLGALGKVLAKDLIRFGFTVQGWSGSKKNIDGVRTFEGEEGQVDFLKSTEILICLLPLTENTFGILNKELFKQLPKGAHVVNVARGGHLIDEDLLEMLDKSHLSGASLDVYHQEPLSTEHPFWEHPKVHMTPHYASVSDTDSVVPQIIENYRRLVNGEELLNQVSKTKGY
ncbi:2-hydroxyacid dehydrogenase [Maribacter sp. HTCC2170]|uniref:2-hydroxyacid dehydrogenase n=1 Tax=Maribacter sp. (strain HTCC2170 / KCCM 42371) TaxID=313603 RepID=UPI00006AFCB4|nr:glyoxylate/hydroxypyruvate reductase A [Maribacter sp. HTCC2170]EAR01299.1 6-phosphogluconate dehydrogenase, NAD-binding:D-isomer specific 2-hydroxyacid dehydrogenase, NAD-binding protein [Maribacter sp. HTCC2170]